MSEKHYISENAQLMAEWNWERNADVSPSRLTLGSGQKVWWKCSKGHEWQAVIANRNNGRGCPYCAGQRPIIGVNDLGTLYPEYLELFFHSTNFLLLVKTSP